MISSAQGYQDEGVNGVDALQVEKRYGEERAKRLRDEGNEQYVDVSLSDKFRHFQDDPWADPAAIKDIRTMFPNNRCQMLILGGGWGGLQYAVRMIQAGILPEDLRIIDTGGGFGGTWYWNRYPGIMCDVESYCYMPLLEEMDYMPKHRYAYGEEIRNYANLVVDKWNFAGSAVFQTKAEKLVWDEASKGWQVEFVQKRKGEPPQTVDIHSQFVVTANGVLNYPKLLKVTGIFDFQGNIFHSSRWDYSITGGTQEDPSLVKLKDKRVAVIGTGASAVQIVPHLAKWSKHLYVVQRTPSSVDRRDQRKTDPKKFHEEVATSAGWQRERIRNFHQHFTTKDQPAVNLVDDEWTRAIALVAITGNGDGPKTMEELPAYLEMLHAIDHPRSSKVRARVEQTVKDPIVAKKLQAWLVTTRSPRCP